MTPLVIDDFIPTRFQNEIESALSINAFPWYYSPSTIKSYLYQGDDQKDSFQFVHQFVKDGMPKSDMIGLIYPITYFIDRALGLEHVGVDRIKANLLTINTSNTSHPAHIDTNQQGFVSVIYYVKDSDGDTVIYNERFGDNLANGLTVAQTVKPKKGRAVIIDSNQFHASSSPKENKTRIVINSVLQLKR